MSHQGLPGWFPECVICGLGHLGGFVCLHVQQEEVHGLVRVTGLERDEPNLWEEDGHWWTRCLLCETAALSDPVAWGSVGYCVGCWNSYVRRGMFPPSRVGRSEADRSPTEVFRPEHPCRHCGFTNFLEGRCSRCRRPIFEDPGYLDDIEELAGEVVAVAHDSYDDLRGTADSGSDLQRAIV